MNRSFNDGLDLRVDKNVVENGFGPLKYNGCPLGVAFANTHIEQTLEHPSLETSPVVLVHSCDCDSHQ